MHPAPITTSANGISAKTDTQTLVKLLFEVAGMLTGSSQADPNAPVLRKCKAEQCKATAEALLLSKTANRA